MQPRKSCFKLVLRSTVTFFALAILSQTAADTSSF